MARFKTQYTDNQSTLEVSSSDTLTVPDMSFSVKEILTRFTRGTVTPDELYRNGYYDDDPDIDHPIEGPQDLTDYESMATRGHEILAEAMERHEHRQEQPSDSSVQGPLEDPSE